MWSISTTQTQVATRDYGCNACEWINRNDTLEGLSFTELRLIAKAKRDGWKIKKGQKYVKMTGIWEVE